VHQHETRVFKGGGGGGGEKNTHIIRGLKNKKCENERKNEQRERKREPEKEIERDRETEGGWGKERERGKRRDVWAGCGVRRKREREHHVIRLKGQAHMQQLVTCTRQQVFVGQWLGMGVSICISLLLPTGFHLLLQNLCAKGHLLHF